jgi:hypothetical protein
MSLLASCSSFDSSSPLTIPKKGKERKGKKKSKQQQQHKELLLVFFLCPLSPPPTPHQTTNTTNTAPIISNPLLLRSTMVKENTIPSSKQTNKQTEIRSRVVSTEQSNRQLRSSSSARCFLQAIDTKMPIKYFF